MSKATSKEAEIDLWKTQITILEEALQKKIQLSNTENPPSNHEMQQKMIQELGQWMRRSLAEIQGLRERILQAEAQDANGELTSELHCELDQKILSFQEIHELCKEFLLERLWVN